MTAAAGITTSAQPPTAVVNIQPGMNIQPVVLVDANGQYVTPGGTATTAGSLATTTNPVNVAAATAPTSGKVLTATSATTATWQALPTGTTAATGVLQLDGTASDILPVAVSGAAGAIGKPADAAHVHPVGYAEPSFSPLDAGFIAWTADAGSCAGGNTTTSQIVNLARINVRSTAVVTNVSVGITTLGNSLTSGQNFVGLYAGQAVGPYTAGQLIGTSADQTAAWGSTGLKTAALTGGPFTAPAGFYWAAILASGGTTPTFCRTTSLAAAFVNAGFVAATARFATVTGSQTVLTSSITPSANNLSGVGIWAALS